jgi:uncharacterized low-complexity protein
MAQHNKTRKTTALAIGATFVASMAASSIATAASNSSNPFAMSDLHSGYSQLAAESTEGKCGGNKAKQMEKEKEKEGKCGANKAKQMEKEGKCGTSKPMPPKEGKCGGAK